MVSTHCSQEGWETPRAAHNGRGDELETRHIGSNKMCDESVKLTIVAPIRTMIGQQWPDAAM